jgi:toxin HigB-1
MSGDRRALGERGRPARSAGRARKKLDQLNQAAALNDLRAPPGNHLERLKGDREGQHSIRINDQWRLCFRWTEAGAEDVEIVDYH